MLPYFRPGRCFSLCTLLTRLHVCAPSILQQENITWIFSIIFVFVFFLWQSQGFDPLLLLPFLFAPTFKSLPATCCWRQPYEAKIYNAVVFFYQLVMMQNFNWKNGNFDLGNDLLSFCIMTSFMKENVCPHLMVFTCLINHVQYMQPLAFFVQQSFFLLFLVLQDLILVYFDANLHPELPVAECPFISNESI